MPDPRYLRIRVLSVRFFCPKHGKKRAEEKLLEQSRHVKRDTRAQSEERR
jgi:hypothetical protein